MGGQWPSTGSTMEPRRHGQRGSPGPSEPDRLVKDIPYRLTHRHCYWFLGAIRSLETALWQGMRGAPQGATTACVTPGVIPGPLGEGGNASSPGSRLGPVFKATTRSR